MKYILKRFLLIFSSLYILMQVISSINISGGWQGLFYSSLILSVLIIFINPIFNLVLLPLNLITLNFFSWLSCIAVFFAWTVLGNVKISSWQFEGINFGPITLSPVYLVKWQIIIVSAIIFIIINKILNWLFK